MNQFKFILFQQNRQQVLRVYCPKIHTVPTYIQSIAKSSGNANEVEILCITLFSIESARRQQAVQTHPSGGSGGGGGVAAAAVAAAAWRRRLHAVLSRARAHGGGGAWCKHRIISSQFGYGISLMVWS